VKTKIGGNRRIEKPRAGHKCETNAVKRSGTCGDKRLDSRGINRDALSARVRSILSL
jgi:hypothetical protein